MTIRRSAPSPLSPPRFVAAALVGAVAALALPLAGCGANIRSVVEGDMRFEHCYRLDDDPGVALDDKRVCWREWNSRYTKGQDRSRIRYARQRISVLDHVAAGDAPVEIDESSAFEGPGPRSPYVVPPAVAPKDASSASLAPRRSIADCTEACGRAYRTCGQQCTGAEACGGFCDDRYRACLQSCF